MINGDGHQSDVQSPFLHLRLQGGEHKDADDTQEQALGQHKQFVAQWWC